MTVAEAIEWINTHHYMELDDEHSEVMRMAVRSLEAWENVKEDILKSIDMIENQHPTITIGYMISLMIIDKHLKEVMK